VITLDIEEIYSLIGLSHRGDSIVLVSGRGGSIEPMDDYVR